MQESFYRVPDSVESRHALWYHMKAAVFRDKIKETLRIKCFTRIFNIRGLEL